MYTYLERINFFENPTARKMLMLIHEKQTNLSVSLDITQKNKWLEIADQIGPEICLLKTHIDTLEDFDSAFINALTTLAKKHQFLIFEDRKFADIGSTVISQYAKGIYKIAEWAHITNAHVLPGVGIIDALKTVGNPKGNALLLIAEMSSKDNLFTEDYVRKTLEFAQSHMDFVIGFIAQKKWLDYPRFL